MLTPKNDRMCIPKRVRLEQDPEAWKAFLKALDEFRERRKYVRYMKMKPFLDYLHPAKRKEDFIQFCKDLEVMRCQTLGMNKLRFYKLVSEFTIVPNGMKYYNPKNLFGSDGSWDADEFRGRIYETIYYICSAIAIGLNGGEKGVKDLMEFIQSLDAMNTIVEVRSSIVYKSKDWYCLVAFRNTVAGKGWTEEEIRRRIKIYYRRNVRKVYPERLLHDLMKGEFDRLVPPPEKDKKIKKNSVILAIEREPFYKEWSKNLF